MRPSIYTPFNFETLTVDDTAGGIGFNLSSYALGGIQAAWAELTIDHETGPVRFRIDGGAPTAAIGHYVAPGQSIVLRNIDEIRAFRAIRTGLTSAICPVTYWRAP